MKLRSPSRTTTVARRIQPLVAAVLGGEPAVRIRCWDDSVLGRASSRTALVLRSPRALRWLLWAPAELGLARAYVAGDLDVEGDIFEALSLRDHLGDAAHHVEIRFDKRSRLELARAASALGALGPPLRPPASEARPRGLLHSRARDAGAIRHHYDIGNDFYRLVLGDTMTYSCAFFAESEMDLDAAQDAKHEHVCRKLGLSEGMRLLDVGCGWGGMVLHAARRHGVRAVGITVSEEQADLARKRVADAGLAHRIEIRLQDYRDVDDGPYDAISSIGMFEHVGTRRLGAYFGTLHGLLPPGGRLLNHAISKPPGRARLQRRSFIGSYVFPDGELQEVGSVVTAMQRHGLEVRDVESLREHYTRTLRSWVANLESNWDEARRLAGDERARVWRLYMAGSALGFEAGRINVHQVLGVRPHPDGTSAMPPTRAEFSGDYPQTRVTPF